MEVLQAVLVDSNNKAIQKFIVPVFSNFEDQKTSMGNKIKQLLETAHSDGVVSLIRPLDEVAIITFPITLPTEIFEVVIPSRIS